MCLSARAPAAAPAAGLHALSISYAQQGNFAAVGPNTQNFTVNPALTQVQLTPSNYYPATGSSFTLSATVNSSTAGAPASGVVTFYDNGKVIGSPTVNAQGQASLTIPTLASGFHSYKAQFGGAPKFATGSSGYLSITAR
jgi:Big-like domain-containing protein